MALSPDGRRLPKPEGIGAPAWTPERQAVALRPASRPHQLDKLDVELWHIAAEGGQPRSLGLAMEAIADLAVHPEGRQIAFAAGKQVNEVWVMENLLSAPGRSPRPLAQHSSQR